MFLIADQDTRDAFERGAFEVLVEAYNDRFQQAPDPHAAATVLLGIAPRYLRGLCDLNHVEPSRSADKCRKRLLNDRWPR